ncbi:hypothetical protein [Bacillus sp. S56]|uniref:hypothetical protein n=1 Tax=Bacillus sp. S56 TaxID=1226987 RepID=UPI00190B15E3|nr:hypothetical protein [Bacillus sp. S56]MBK0075555.1 hypothetical protein [Bacillus sp. S56]
MLSGTVKVYDNIFHSYRSGDKILQSENNITKAFINVFEHSHIDLRKNFLIQELKLPENIVKERIIFDLQIKKTLEHNFKKAFVLGISNKVSKLDNYRELEEDSDGVPDAAFLSEDLCMLIEVKVRDAKLTIDQIKKHENLFINGQDISEPLFRTWDEILCFLERQREELEGEKYSITRFLIDQFMSFCGINGVGSNRSKEFYFACFPSNIRQLTRDIDTYILEKYNSDIDHLRQAKSKGISYTRKGRRGFFAKIESEAHILILSFESSKGDLVQESLNKIGVGKKRNKNAKAFATPNREAWVDLYKVESLKILTPFIDDAFRNRP